MRRIPPDSAWLRGFRGQLPRYPHSQPEHFSHLVGTTWTLRFVVRDRARVHEAIVTDALRVYAPAECAADGYPPQWHSIAGGPGIKHLVRTAAGDRCVRCRHPYAKGAGEWSFCDDLCTHDGPTRMYEPPENIAAFGTRIQAQWRILTVHHLTGEKHDCRWWNLAALCQRCHLAIQGKVQMGRVYPFEHSEWFKPYAAGWYAWMYLGLELDQAETLARLDELLALERIA